MRLKYSKKLTYICFIFLMISTFFSKSLTYWLSAKVKTATPTNGIIKENKVMNEFEIIFENEEILYFDSNVIDKFYIKSLINKGQLVTKDEVLFQLSIPDNTNIKDDYRSDIKSLETEILHIDKEKKLSTEKYIREVERINESLKKIELEIKDLEAGSVLELIELKSNIHNKSKEVTSKKEHNHINEELYKIGVISLNEYKLEIDKLEAIQNELELLEMKYFHVQNNLKAEYINSQEGLHEQLYELEYGNDIYILSKDNALQNLFNKRVEIENKLERLTVLENDFTIKSPIKGIITELKIFDSSHYIAGEVLCKINPISKPPLYKVNLPIEDIENWSETNDILLSIGDKHINCEIVDIMYRADENRDLVIRPLETLDEQDYLKETTIKLNKSSEFYPTIIPSNALIDGLYVYTLREEDYGLWGTRYFVQKLPVTIGDYNSKEIGIRSGLTTESKIVFDWDRELREGQRVMIKIP